MILSFMGASVSMLRHLNNVLCESATNVYQYRHFEMNVRVWDVTCGLRVMRGERDTSGLGYRALYFREMLRVAAESGLRG